MAHAKRKSNIINKAVSKPKRVTTKRLTTKTSEKTKVQPNKSIAITLEKILNASQGSLYWKNTNGIYLGCNDFLVKENRKVSKADIIGKTDNMLWPHKTKMILEDDQDILKKGKALCRIEKVGNERFYSIKAPIKDKNNNIIGIIGYSLNISHPERLERELKLIQANIESVNNAKKQFLENLNFKQRSLLKTIHFSDPEISTRNNQKIQEYADHLISSVTALLSFKARLH